MADMNGIAVSLEGWEDLRDALHKLTEETALRAGNNAARAGANYLKARIVEALPTGPGKPKLRRNKAGTIIETDYGHLRDNVKVRGARRKAREAMNLGGEFEFTISPGAAFWGKFLEYGTVKMAARPVWRPVFDAETDATVNRVGEVLQRNILRFARRQRA